MRIKEDTSTRHYPGHYLNPLERPMYVIKMGWRRWGPQARIKWLEKLRDACEESIRRIEEDLWYIDRDQEAYYED